MLLIWDSGGLMVGQIIAKEFRLDWTLWGLGIWIGLYVGGSLLIYLQEKLSSHGR